MCVCIYIYIYMYIIYIYIHIYIYIYIYIHIHIDIYVTPRGGQGGAARAASVGKLGVARARHVGSRCRRRKPCRVKSRAAFAWSGSHSSLSAILLARR